MSLCLVFTWKRRFPSVMQCRISSILLPGKLHSSSNGVSALGTALLVVVYMLVRAIPPPPLHVWTSNCHEHHIFIFFHASSPSTTEAGTIHSQQHGIQSSLVSRFSRHFPSHSTGNGDGSDTFLVLVHLLDCVRPLAFSLDDSDTRLQGGWRKSRRNHPVSSAGRCTRGLC